MLSYVILLAGSVVFSIVGVKLGMGAGGCAFGSVVAETFCSVLLAGHFFRKSNTCFWTSHFSWRDMRTIVTASFGDAAAFLCEAALLFFLNGYFIRLFGPTCMPVVAVVTAAWGFHALVDSVVTALQPIVAVYHAEKNVRSVRHVMRAATRLSIGLGLGLSVFFLVWPSAAVSLVGVTDPELVRESIVAVRLISCGFIPMVLAGLFNSYYMFVERPILSAFMTVLCYFVLTCVCTIAFSLMRADLAWLGLGLGPGVGILITAAVVWMIAGRRGFPLLLDDSREAELHVFSLTLNAYEIAQTSAQVAAILHERGCSDSIALKASLMTEEVLMAVRDRNSRRVVLGEVSLDLNAGVVLTIRDDGSIFDITDADAEISSLRTFLVASMMQRQEGRLNLITTGFNRNVFKFA